MTDEQIKTIERLLEEGCPVTDIAAAVGMSFNTFSLRLAQSGLRIVRRLEPIQPIRPALLAEREPVEAVAA